MTGRYSTSLYIRVFAANLCYLTHWYTVISDSILMSPFTCGGNDWRMCTVHTTEKVGVSYSKISTEDWAAMIVSKPWPWDNCRRQTSVLWSTHFRGHDKEHCCIVHTLLQTQLIMVATGRWCWIKWDKYIQKAIIVVEATRLIISPSTTTALVHFVFNSLNMFVYVQEYMRSFLECKLQFSLWWKVHVHLRWTVKVSNWQAGSVCQPLS